MAKQKDSKATKRSARNAKVVAQAPKVVRTRKVERVAQQPHTKFVAMDTTHNVVLGTLRVPTDSRGERVESPLTTAERKWGLTRKLLVIAYADVNGRVRAAAKAADCALAQTAINTFERFAQAPADTYEEFFARGDE